MTIVVQNASGSGGGGSGPVLQPIGTIATRPASLSGELQTFIDTTLANVLRTASDDNQVIKTRRRATNPTRTADATVTLLAELVEAFRFWYEVNCRSGVLPTKFKVPPDCREQIWRFASPPSYDWVDRKACKIAFKLEKLPNWIDT